MFPERAKFYIASSSSSTSRANLNSSLPLSTNKKAYGSAAPAITADVFESSLKVQSSLTVPGGRHSRESSGSKTIRANSAVSLMDTSRHKRDLLEHLAFNVNDHEALEDLAHEFNAQRAWNHLKENYRAKNPEAIDVLHRLAFESKNDKALEILTHELDDSKAWGRLERQYLNKNQRAEQILEKLMNMGDEHATDILLDADKHEYDFDKAQKTKKTKPRRS